MEINAADKTCVSSLKLLGDYWTLRILNVLQDESMRFCDLQRALDNLNPVTLTARLKRLEEAGLVERTEGTEDGCSVVYGLLPQGHKALPVVKAINEFAKTS
jgi:DNA-binding HxlR family transcriptional regulator